MTSARMRINDPSNNKLDSHYNMVAKNTSHKLCNATTTRLLKIDNREILLTDTVVDSSAGFRLPTYEFEYHILYRYHQIYCKPDACGSYQNR